MTETVPVEELRVCSDCAEIKPLTDFRRRHSGGDVRMYQCRQCHALAERCRLQKHRSIETGRRIQALATAMKRRNRSARQLETLLQLSIVSAGGFEALLRDWHDQLQKCLEKGKPTPRLLTFYETILGLATKSIRCQSGPEKPSINSAC